MSRTTRLQASKSAGRHEKSPAAGRRNGQSTAAERGRAKASENKNRYSKAAAGRHAKPFTFIDGRLRFPWAEKLSEGAGRLSVKTRLIIILAVAVVFIAAALITSLVFFIKAEKLSEDAALMSRAVTETESVAETLKSADGDMQKASQLLRSHKSFDIKNDSLTLYYDNNFEPSSKSGSAFETLIRRENQGGCYSYSIKVFRIQNTEDSHSSAENLLKENQTDVFYELSFKAVNEGGDADND